MSASNIDAAATFLELLDPDADSFTFQTFDDNEELKRGHLTKVLHGSLADQAQRLAALQKGGAGVFVTISETDFAGRKKVNITRARAVFVDLDGAPLKPVLTCTLEPHIIVESSPGRWHAYWIAEGLTLDQFEGVQKALVARFKGDSACVDCSRVMRLPGFYHQKGEPFLTRIHGMSDRLPYKAEQILAELPPVKAAGCKANGGAEGGEDRETSDLIRGIMTGEEYHPALLRLAWRYASAGWSRTQIINALQGFMDARTDRDARWTARRKRIPMLVDTAIKKQEADRDAQDQPARKMLDRLAADHDEAEAAENAPEAMVEIKGDAEFDFSHDGLALDMGRQWARRARHVAPWGQWLFWDGARWAPDAMLLHLTRTRNYLRARADRLVRDAKSGKFMPDNQDRDHALKVAEAVAKTLRQAATIAAVSGLARSNAELAANVDQWDADPWLLGTPSGTVDLRTGIMRKPSAEDYITKITTVAPGGEPVRWLAFLDRITNGDVDLRSYLQRFAGYALTGSTREHTFNYGHGTGANGKSVWIEALKGILGEYACSFPTEMLMVTQNDRHPTEIARMRGCRLAIGSETEEGRQWAESKIKALTGGDTVAARFMHKDFFEYQPQFKLFIVGNHKPGLRCVDEAMRRRLHFVPFLVTIPPEERDKDLSAKLQEEWPAILRWAIDGCLAWQQQGLNPPECVQVATNEYLSSEDAFEVWRAECLIEDKNAWSSSKDLWKSWKQWAEAAGEFVGKQRALSDRLLQIGCKSYAHPRTRARGYRGVQIQPTDDVKVAPWAA